MKSRINLDALGISASLACAIHCAVLPLFFGFVPFFGINIIHNFAFEASMIGIAFAIGGYSFYHSYKKHHHNWTPTVLFTLGIVLLVTKLFFAHIETWLLIPAVALIITAHYLNFRYCRQLPVH